jgi:S1-C subfamily serine protease
MVRIAWVVMVLLLPVLASPAAEEKEKKDKPARVGVQITRGKEASEIIIQVVLDNSPAEKAGLKTGDRIRSINGLKPVDLKATVAVIRALKPDKKAKFVIERDGKEKTIEVVPEAAE